MPAIPAKHSMAVKPNAKQSMERIALTIPGLAHGFSLRIDEQPANHGRPTGQGKAFLKEIEPMKKKIGTIDATPTWGNVIEHYINTLENPNAAPAQKKIARDELRRAAKSLDETKALLKELTKVTVS